MDKQEKRNKVQRIFLLSAYVAIATFLIGTTLAVLLYPSYSFFSQFFSELGIRQTISTDEWKLTAAPFPEIFNVSLMISGLFLVPFFPTAFGILSPQGWKRQLPVAIAALSGSVGAIFLFFVGVFDAGKFFRAHFIVALGLYYCIVITSLFWGIGILALSRSSPYKRSRLWILDPLLTLVSMLIALINTGLFRLDKFFVGSTFTMVFYQKALAYVFIIVFGYVAVRLYLLLRNSRKETRSNFVE